MSKFDILIPPPPLPPPSYRFGVITSTNPLRVRLDGDTSPVASTPISTEPVWSGDRVIVLIQNRQLIITGRIAPTTDWQNIPIASGFSRQGTQDPQVQKVGRRVYMRWGWSNAGLAVNSAYILGTIPSGYRPSLEVHCPVASSSAPTMGSAVIQTGGGVQLKTGNAVGNYYLFDAVSWETNQ